jgi:SAM-dependent methyltransferase
MDGKFGAAAMKARALSQFNNASDVWPEDNAWSAHTRREISRRLHRHLLEFSAESSIDRLLNIGSHGNAYGVRVPEHVHIDLAENALAGLPLAVVGDAELLPFADHTFDIAVCVGSVINYCSPPRVFFEIARVLKPGGHLLLEYETSESFEFVMSGDFGKDVALVETFYNCASDKIYVYSSRYIQNALHAAGFSIQASERFHILSALAFRLIKSERIAATFARFDDAISSHRLGQRFSANIFVAAEQRGQ